jgi:hypothetical protein
VADAQDTALHLEGVLRGPLKGLGPELRLEAWLRADRWLRADLRFEDDDGRPRHEVLIWGPDTALLFDRQRGRWTDLGEDPGTWEVEEGVFRVEHLLWLGLGRWVGGDPPPARRERSQWRLRSHGVGMRIEPAGDGRYAWTELVWRGERLQAVPRGDWTATAWGPVAREIDLEGTILESKAQIRWTVGEIPVFGDELLDPLADPHRRQEDGNRSAAGE